MMFLGARIEVKIISKNIKLNAAPLDKSRKISAPYILFHRGFKLNQLLN